VNRVGFLAEKARKTVRDGQNIPRDNSYLALQVKAEAKAEYSHENMVRVQSWMVDQLDIRRDGKIVIQKPAAAMLMPG
jgi:hypothetical protein